MRAVVARAAQRNQVLLRIAARVTAELLVMNFKIGHCAAGLASPAVPAQYFKAELFI
jgi:hypothetical protein